jgi:uncharacterized protein YndB with AHSA1/START domain
MPSWTQQALIEAPVENVWALLADPSRFAEWGGAIEVTGAPTKIEKGSQVEMKTRGPLGINPTTTFEVERLQELKEIKLRCQTSGMYSHWTLTEARGATFADVELGVEPRGARSRLMGTMITKGLLRRTLESSLDGVRRVTESRQPG